MKWAVGQQRWVQVHFIIVISLKVKSAVGHLLYSCWSANGQLLISCWSADDQLLVSCWSAVHQLMDISWSADGQLLISWWSADGHLLVSWWSADGLTFLWLVLLHLLMMFPGEGGLVHAVSWWSADGLTFLWLVLLHLLMMFPGEGGLVHAVSLHAKLAPETGLIICRRGRFHVKIKNAKCVQIERMWSTPILGWIDLCLF